MDYTSVLQRSITYGKFDDDILKRVLRNPYYLVRLYRINDLNMFNHENANKMDVLDQLKIDYIEALAVKIAVLGPKDEDEKKFLEGIRNVLLDVIKNNRVSYINSLLLKPNYANYFFTGDSYNLYKQYLDSTSKVCGEIFKKVKAGIKITPLEDAKLFRFLESKLSPYDSNYQGIFDYFLKANLKGISEPSIFENKFIIQYLTFLKCKNKDLPYMNCYVTSVDLKHNKPFWNGLHSYDGLVLINERVCNRDNLLLRKRHSYAYVVLHELEHYYQAYSVRNNIFNEANYIYSKKAVLQQNQEYNEFMTNYGYKETENKANVKAGYELLELYRKYNISHENANFALYQNHLLRTSLSRALQKKKDGTLTYIGDYNIEMMEKELVKNPLLLSKFPILKILFQEDGYLKSPYEILSVYTELDKKRDENKKRILSEVIEYMISHGIFGKVDISRCSYDDVLSYFMIIADDFEKQVRAIKDMLDSYTGVFLGSLDDRDKFNTLFRRRVKVIKAELAIVNKYRGIINEYIKWNSNRPDRRLTRFSYSVFSNNLGIRTIEDRLRDNPNLVNSELVDEIKEISHFKV